MNRAYRIIVIRHIVNQLAHSLELLVIGKAFEAFFESWRQKIDPTYNALDEIMRVSQFQQPLGLLLLLPGLHGNRTIKADFGEM